MCKPDAVWVLTTAQGDMGNSPYPQPPRISGVYDSEESAAEPYAEAQAEAACSHSFVSLIRYEVRGPRSAILPAHVAATLEARLDALQGNSALEEERARIQEVLHAHWEAYTKSMGP